ncbi:hypothetical protein BS78_04G150400 [Paspalum vaginatum]|nr:hypothetical protein BS78_04G150400 [Paspalum vaginatum]
MVLVYMGSGLASAVASIVHPVENVVEVTLSPLLPWVKTQFIHSFRGGGPVMV